jgi:hypothetical protein
MSFQYNFTSHSATSQEKDSESNEGTQQSADFSIDVNQITPPTFKFGQFGQAPLPTDWNFSSSTESVNREAKAPPLEEDDDSFLAEPSISAGQFDATFGFTEMSSNEQQASSVPIDDTFNSSVSSISVASIPLDPQVGAKSSSPSSSTRSIPKLVEEPLEEPVYLEEPAPHSVEELLKATVDGDATAVFKDSWESFSPEELEAAEKEFTEGSVEFVAPLPHDDTPIEPKVSDVVSAIESIEYNSSVGKESVNDIDSIKSQSDIVNTEDVKEGTAKVDNAPVDNASSDEEQVENSKAVPVEKKKKEASPVKQRAPRKASKEKSLEKIPVVTATSGRPVRERKAVQRLSTAPAKVVKETAELSIPAGSGVRLGDIEAINQTITKKLASDKNLMSLHRLLFDRPGEARQRKSNLRSFCGLEDGAPTNAFEAKLQKRTVAELKELAGFLALSGASDKSALIAKISGFLVKPVMKKTAKPAADKSKKVAAIATTKRTAAAAAKKVTKKPKTAAAKKETKPPKFLSPETIDSDVDSDVEREVLSELENE